MTCRVLSLVVLGTVLSGAVDAGEAELARARLVWADFDGDGLEDVYVVRPNGQDSLFRNVGDGSFEDVTAHALPCVSCASIEVAWRDVDLDRRPDLLRLLVSGGVELLQNRGNGVFDDVTVAAGLERVTGASAARWLDYDADGRADLELTTESAPLVYHNLGGFLFEAVTFDEVGGTATGEAPTVRAIPGALDEEGGLPTDGTSVPTGGPDHGPRRTGGDPVAALGGPLVDKLHPDPLVPGTPPVDPLEPGDPVEFQLPPFANRCAWSVKDTSGGDCVLTSTIPTLGKLYPISTNLFVSTGGNVGIGTTSPTAKLDVAGTARMTDTLTLNPAGDQALNVSTGSIYKGGVLFMHTKGGGGNTAVGRPALSSVTTGTADTAIGSYALANNTTGYSNTASGAYALRLNTTGINNTASGAYALRSNTLGDRNTANGYSALRSNTTGSNNTASGVDALRNNTTGSNNTASGLFALRNNTTGYNNTASGYQALFSNSTGFFNTAVGERALRANSTGDRNTASGAVALFSNTTGNNNTASGSHALRSNTTGYNNTASGYQALYSNSTGFFNTAVGDRALRSNSTGDRNTASGVVALRSNTTGFRNTASGVGSLYFNTSGSRNTAAGNDALFSNTTGSNNTASGTSALLSNLTGVRNTASGFEALRSTTTGSYNTADGGLALRFNTIGAGNAAFGDGALYANTTGLNNVGCGGRTLNANTSGNENTASGFRALQNNTTGARNIGVGRYAGNNLTTGNDNIAIGSFGVAGEGATIRVGEAGTHSKAFIAGIRGTMTVNANAIAVLIDSAGQLGTVSSSARFKKDIADMGDATARLLELRPVVFHYKQAQEVPCGEVPLEYGLIAEEVAEIFPDLVVNDEEGMPFTVKYHLLSAMLLNELKKQAQEMDALHDELVAHDSELQELRSLLSAIAPRTSPASLPTAIPAGSR